jgi:sarcosine oxidase subunit alpha
MIRFTGKLGLNAQQNRLPSGGLINRSQRTNFTFDNRQYVGYSGDTLASALLASGLRIFGRSFKYHRPRGVLSAGSEEPNALIELRSGVRLEPNTRATMVELYEGLEARSQNRWPTLRYDLLAINQLFAPLIASGFYYKTFMWPSSFWEAIYEPLIRRSAGMGHAPTGADPDFYEKLTVHTDVLIIGSGPAGLSAALAAAGAGGRVIICEEDNVLGGRLLVEHQVIDDEPARRWVARAEAMLRTARDVRILIRTTVFGAYDHGVYAAIERVNDHVPSPSSLHPRQRTWKIIAKRVVLTSGAVERPLLFGNNDRPGVMLAGAVRTYLNRFAVVAGRPAVVCTNNDDGFRTVADLMSAGVEVRAIIDTRQPSSIQYASAAKKGEMRVLSGSRVQCVRGRSIVRSVDVITPNGLVNISCDLVAMSGGWSPNLQLACHLGGKPEWNERIYAFVPALLQQQFYVAGAAAGVMTTHDAVGTGTRAGWEAAKACGFEGKCPDPPKCEPEDAAIAPSWHPTGPSGKVFVDFQNDVTCSDIDLAQLEGFESIEHVKRYTTAGMGADQGKTSTINTISYVAKAQAKPIPDVGTTTFRPPYTPICIGAVAGANRGKRLRPERLPPTHAWAEELGATFMQVGLWLRAQFFPQLGEDLLSSCTREVLTVRNHVGACDVSTLAKIDVQGSNAATFLDLVYTNTISSLKIGRTRYGLMLREDGFIFDDGTVARLDNDHFILTGTTVNAAATLAHLEFCSQWLWPELDVSITDITEDWAQVALAGPRSRDVLRKLLKPGFDISNSAFPHLSASTVNLLDGVTGRLFRMSYSGELGYELAVPAGSGDALMQAIMAAGQEFGVTPYGLEAMSVMRIEKGHVGAGELTGRTTARDLGLNRLLATNKEFIGRAMSTRPGLLDPARPTLAGFRAVGDFELTAGARLLNQGATARAPNDQGYMTSVAYSPSLGTWIGLGLIRGGVNRRGELVKTVDFVRGRDCLVEVTPPCFFDPKGERIHA